MSISSSDKHLWKEFEDIYKVARFLIEENYPEEVVVPTLAFAMAVRDSPVAGEARDILIEADKETKTQNALRWNDESWCYESGRFELHYGLTPVEVIGDIVVLERPAVSAWITASTPFNIDGILLRAFKTSKTPDKNLRMPAPRRVEAAYKAALKRESLAWREQQYRGEPSVTWEEDNDSVVLVIRAGRVAQREASGTKATDTRRLITLEEAKVEPEKARAIVEALRGKIEDALTVVPANDWSIERLNMLDIGEAMYFPPPPTAGEVMAFPPPRWVSGFYELAVKFGAIGPLGNPGGPSPKTIGLVCACVAWFLSRSLRNRGYSMRSYRAAIQVALNTYVLRESDKKFPEESGDSLSETSQLWGNVSKRGHILKALYERFGA